MTKALVLAIAFTVSSQAMAHDDFTGKTNPVTGYTCCYGEGNPGKYTPDCLPLAAEDWWQEGDEYVVNWKDGNQYRIPSNQAQPAFDRNGRAAACVLAGTMRCIFIPFSG